MIKILKSFFCSDSTGKFRPPYFWITTLMFCVLLMFVLKLSGNKLITDAMFATGLGSVVAWVKIYNDGKKNKGINK